jgi:RHS repeat-associated protein
VLAEWVNGEETVQYLWSPVYVDSLIMRDSGGNRIYVQQDANYNTTSLIDNTGAVLERYIYDPYGAPTVLNPDWSVDADGTDFSFVYLHQGGRHDSTLKLSHFRNRDLHVELGRWTRQDPLGFVDGSNVYQFVVSSPTHFVDPMGLVTGVAHHPYPLFLGGNINQVVVILDSVDAHKRVHQVFRNHNIFYGDGGREAWEGLTDEQRRKILRESLEAGGINPDVIDDIVDRSTKGANPGSNNSPKRPDGKPEDIVDEDGKPTRMPRHPKPGVGDVVRDKAKGKAKTAAGRLVPGLGKLMLAWDVIDIGSAVISVVFDEGEPAWGSENPA